ncbi:MAG TPA: radical SAM protein, partial [Acidobacteria bacterium]|nr:radical SAM protein [Acidobacteriota bacterium]
MLRASSYVLYVDLPDLADEMLLVQTYTGAFDRVSRRIGAYVRSLEAARPAKPLYGEWSPSETAEPAGEPPSDTALETLTRRGYLTRMTPEQEEEFFRLYVERLHGLFANRWPTYLFMPTYDCNLRCSYCFQDHMRTDPGYSHLLKRMTPAMVDRIFLAMPKVEALHGIPSEAETKMDIGFFGGEPLLADNRPIVEHVIGRARARGAARFWAISNGTELDAYEDLLSPELLGNVQITLDGPPGRHDKRRIYADGSGSWAKIVGNIQRCLDRGVQVSIRTNVDRGNLGELPELADEIIRHGWNRFPHFGTQVAPIRGSHDKPGSRETLNTWELDQLLTELRGSHPETSILGRVDDGLRSQADRVFRHQGIPSFKSSFCAAHTGMYIFDPFGDIYACWEKTGDQKVRIGHVDDQSEVQFAFDVQALWRNRTVTSNPVCLRCRYNLFCGGGCAVLAMDSGGDFYRNYCDGFAQRFRAAVADSFVDFT